VTRDSTWISYNAASRRLSLCVHVQPNARRSEAVGLHGGALKVKIAAPAVDNKANTELIEFLSKTLEVSKSAIAIRRGATSRRKMVEITGGPELAARLKALVASRITTHESRLTPST
jgi:uncharacterized protein (TIGR00251 family)